MKHPISAWQLIKPYWVSEQRWIAFGLLALVIALDLSNVYFVVQISYWQKDFFDALAAYKLDVMKPLMWTLLLIIGANITVRAFSVFFKQLLEIRWRSWLTTNYIQDWFKGNNFYHIERQYEADNPDQRIAQDLDLMAQNSLGLFTGLIKNCVNLVSYSIIIWSLSETWLFSINGHDYTIPGALLWAAILYALLGSFVMEKIGKPIVSLDYKQQQYEADFRALLMNVRKNSEQIALYRGQAEEKKRLMHSFSAIRQNWRGIMTYTKRIAFTESIYIEVGAYLPYFLIIPQYFAKKVTMGGVMQLSSGFARLRASLSWFIFYYKDLSELRATLKRLGEFQAVMQQKQVKTIQYQQGDVLSVESFVLNQPSGEYLVNVPNIELKGGERLLIQGESGVGKSTLLRALAGLWLYGDGKITFPENKDILFLPQKLYLPIGDLKSILCYPKAQDDFSDQACVDALNLVGLASQTPQLYKTQTWDTILSLGEQQKLAFAKIFLHQPDYLFLDEATSALDLANETRLYQLLLEKLPQVTLVSVAHHENVKQFHTQTLKLAH